MSFLPEFAIRLIGRNRIARHAPVRDEYFNNVWRATTHDGEELVVRRMMDGQAFARENAALTLLGESGLPVPTVMASGATVMVCRASAGEPMTFPDEGLLRQSGYALRRLHGLGRAVPASDACPWNPAPGGGPLLPEHFRSTCEPPRPSRSSSDATTSSRPGDRLDTCTSFPLRRGARLPEHGPDVIRQPFRVPSSRRAPGAAMHGVGADTLVTDDVPGYASGQAFLRIA